MKRFTFTLGQVLRLARQRERMAEVRERAARMSCDQAYRTVQSLQDLMQQHSDLLSKAISRGAMVNWPVLLEVSTRLYSALRNAEIKHQALDLEHQHAMQILTRLRTEVESLRLLRRSEWLDYRKQVARYDQILADEGSLRRWNGRMNDIETTA